MAEHTKVLNESDVCALVRLSRSTIYRRERAGEFPCRMQLSPNRIGWRERDILDWISTRPSVMGGGRDAA